MALEVHLVAGLAVVLAAEEVVEADLVEAAERGEGGEVAADAVGVRVGADHHDGGVPADVGPDAPLEVLVAGEPGSWSGGMVLTYGVETWPGKPTWCSRGPLEELHQEEPGAGLAPGVEDGVEGVDPLGRLLGIDVGELVENPSKITPP